MATKKLLFLKDELHDVEQYLKREILRAYDIKGKDEEFSLVIRTNNNTMRSKIKCIYQINYTISDKLYLAILAHC